MKKAKVKVEFFGIDFGLRDAKVCTLRGSEYLDQDTMREIETEVKKKGIFGLERKVICHKVRKFVSDTYTSGNCGIPWYSL